MNSLISQEGAQAYLTIAIQDSPEKFFVALRHVIEARGGLIDIAQKLDIAQAEIAWVLNQGGVPCFTTIMKILDAFGFQLEVQPKS